MLSRRARAPLTRISGNERTSMRYGCHLPLATQSHNQPSPTTNNPNPKSQTPLQLSKRHRAIWSMTSDQPSATEGDPKKFSWPPLESNPEVFTSYLHSIGLSPTFSIGEVFGFDEDLLAFLPQPVLGVIVCFERLIPKSSYRDQDKGSVENYDKVHYYMHQSKVLGNPP